MTTPYHSFYRHLGKKRRLSYFDKVASVAAVLYPMSGLPQVVLVFRGQVDGVSITSWLLFTVFSSFFFVYGLVHRVKPMILTNFIWMALDLFVVIGTLTHRMMS